jgi:hypothetical protein
LNLNDLLMTNRAAGRHFIGYVGAADAFWRMRRSVNNVRLHVTLQLTSATTGVLFVKKAVSSVLGCLIPVQCSTNPGYDSSSGAEHGPWGRRASCLGVKSTTVYMVPMRYDIV